MGWGRFALFPRAARAQTRTAETQPAAASLRAGRPRLLLLLAARGLACSPLRHGLRAGSLGSPARVGWYFLLKRGEGEGGGAAGGESWWASRLGDGGVGGAQQQWDCPVRGVRLNANNRGLRPAQPAAASGSRRRPGDGGVRPAAARCQRASRRRAAPARACPPRGHRGRRTLIRGGHAAAAAARACFLRCSPQPGCSCRRRARLRARRRRVVLWGTTPPGVPPPCLAGRAPAGRAAAISQQHDAVPGRMHVGRLQGRPARAPRQAGGGGRRAQRSRQQAQRQEGGAAAPGGHSHSAVCMSGHHLLGCFGRSSSSRPHAHQAT